MSDHVFASCHLRRTPSRVSGPAALCCLADDPGFREVRFRFRHAIGVGDVACERLFPVAQHLVPVGPGIHGFVVAIHGEGAERAFVEIDLRVLPVLAWLIAVPMQQLSERPAIAAVLFLPPVSPRGSFLNPPPRGGAPPPLQLLSSPFPPPPPTPH